MESLIFKKREYHLVPLEVDCFSILDQKLIDWACPSGKLSYQSGRRPFTDKTFDGKIDHQEAQITEKPSQEEGQNPES